MSNEVKNNLDAMLLNEMELIQNAANRIPICLCIDASYSMGLNRRIQQINDGIKQFIQNIREDYIAADSVELCIISFGGSQARIEVPFKAAADIDYQNIRVSGNTPMGQAVEFAMHEIEKRVELYKRYGITCYKPWLILLSDGEATDDYLLSAAKLVEKQKERRIKVLCIKLGSEEESLSRFHINREVESLEDLALGDFFADWLSTSVATLSKQSPYAEYPEYNKHA